MSATMSTFILSTFMCFFCDQRTRRFYSRSRIVVNVIHCSIASVLHIYFLFSRCPSPQVHKSRVMWVGSRSSLNISPSVQLESPSSSDLNPRPLWYFYVWCNGTNLGVVIIYLLIYLSPLGGTVGGCTILVKHCTDNICTVLHQHSIGGWFL